MAYYYFAASLPALSLDQPATMTEAEYVDLCRDHLAARDLQAVNALFDGAPSDHVLVCEWRRRDTQLRNAVVRIRAQRRQIDATAALRPHSGYELAIESAVERAFQAGDPLQRERQLDELRWRLLDEIQGTDSFGVPMILTYLLRLQLCNRWSALTEEQGKARMQDTLDSTSSSGIEEATNAQ